MKDLYKRLNNLSEAQQTFILSGVFSCLEHDLHNKETLEYIEAKVNFFKEANNEFSKR